MGLLRAPKGATKKKKIIGRGNATGQGGTAGRGHNGQNSRSGGGVRPGFEGGQMPLYRRVAIRGFSNHPFKKNFKPVNLNQLEERFSDGDTVTLESLREKGLVKGHSLKAKILGAGEITKKLTVEALRVSKSAQEKIEKAGGKVILPAPAETESKETKKEE
jgi:large subunit ribosomal protein L15